MYSNSCQDLQLDLFLSKYLVGWWNFVDFFHLRSQLKHTASKSVKTVGGICFFMEPTVRELGWHHYYFESLNFKYPKNQLYRFLITWVMKYLWNTIFNYFNHRNNLIIFSFLIVTIYMYYYLYNFMKRKFIMSCNKNVK